MAAPLQVIALSFSRDAGAEDRILAEVDRLRGRGVLRLLDMLFVAKSQDGTIEHLAIGAEERRAQSAQAKPALFQHAAQALRQAEQRCGNGVFADDGFGETLLGHQVGQGVARADRLVMPAQ